MCTKQAKSNFYIGPDKDYWFCQSRAVTYYLQAVRLKAAQLIYNHEPPHINFCYPSLWKNFQKYEFTLGIIHKVRRSKGERGFNAKVYGFYDVILLFKSVQRGEGVPENNQIWVYLLYEWSRRLQLSFALQQAYLCSKTE